MSVADLRHNAGPALPAARHGALDAYAQREQQEKSFAASLQALQPKAASADVTPSWQAEDAPLFPTFDKVKDLIRNTPRSLKGLAHFTFMIVFTAWLLNSRDSGLSYIFAQLVRESVLDSEFSPADTDVATTFKDITTISQVEQYLRGPFLDSLFADQTIGVNSFATGPFDPGWFNSQARLVGAARIRQVRVATNSCATSSTFRQLVPTCYPSLGNGPRRRAPLYGVDLGGGMRRVYRYDEFPGELPFLAAVYSYEGGGYVADIPARRLHAQAILDQMSADRFLSMETRVLTVDFTLYNANINTFCIARLVFERLETGGVLPSATLRTARLLPYEGDGGPKQLALDGAIISYITLMMVVLLRALWRGTWERSLLGYWCSEWWITHDWLVVILFWAVLALRYYVRAMMAQLATNAPFDPDRHYPLFNVAMTALAETNVLAVMSLLVYFQVFQFVGDLPYVHRFGTSMARAQKDLVAVLAVLMVMMLAYASAFHLAFGADVYEMRDMSASFMTLIRFIVGDVNINHLLALNPTLAVILVLSFTFLIYLILVNMAVAVLVRSYSSQPSEAQAAEELIGRLSTRSAELFLRSADLAREALTKGRTVASALVAGREAEGVALDSSVLDALTADALKPRGAGRGSLAFQRGSLVPPPPAPPKVLADAPVDADDPIIAAQRAFSTEAESTSQLGVIDTKSATERLKLLYLRLTDEDALTNEMIETVRTAVHALRDENYALTHALAAEGVRFDPLDPLRTLAPKEDAATAEPDGVGGAEASEGAGAQDATVGAKAKASRGTTSDLMAISAVAENNKRTKKHKRTGIL